MSSNQERVDVAVDASIATISFSNSPHGYISNKGAALLETQFKNLLEDETVHVIILTGGQDNVFIRHADVSQIQRASEALVNHVINADSFLDSPFSRLGRLLDSATKPIIAAINGVCMGGGLEIALCCTMRVASESVTSIGLPEIKLDLFPGSGATQRLPPLIGHHRARLFMLQGQVVTAKKAHEMGLIDDCVPSAIDYAKQLANDLAQRSPAAINAIMALTQTAISEQGLSDELIAFANLLKNEKITRTNLEKFLNGGQRLEELN